MFDRSKWRSNLVPSRANTVVALQNRSLGVRGWNSQSSPLHHFVDCSIDHLSTINEKFELPARTRTTFITAFSQDNALLASCHGNHNTHILNVKTKKVVRSLSGHARSPWCVTFHPKTNEIVATGSLNGEVRVWDLRGDGSESWTLEHPNEEQIAIASLSFHPYDHVLAIAGGNEIYFWDWSLPQPFASVKTNTKEEKVRLVRFDPRGHYVITGVGGVEEDELDSDHEMTHPLSFLWNLDPPSSDSLPGSRPSQESERREQAGSSSTGNMRREISETHQRILHARVSVNEEIRQQYTRLQRLRQERHRLEMRLRELQNSANEVRNSTPALREAEISFAENQTRLDMEEDTALSLQSSTIANDPPDLHGHLQMLQARLTSDSGNTESTSSTWPALAVHQPAISSSASRLSPVHAHMAEADNLWMPALSSAPSSVSIGWMTSADTSERMTSGMAEPSQQTSGTQSIRTRSFRERLQALQNEFQPTSSSRIPTLGQRTIQPHLSSTYFQPQIAPYVFFPEALSNNEQPAQSPAHPRWVPPRDRILRPVPNSPSISPFMLPDAHTRPNPNDFFAELLEISVPHVEPISDAEMPVDPRLSVATMTSSGQNEQRVRSPIVSRDPMWSVEAEELYPPISDSELTPSLWLTRDSTSPTSLRRSSWRRRAQIRRRPPVGIDRRGSLYSRPSVIRSTPTALPTRLMDHHTLNLETPSGEASPTQTDNPTNLLLHENARSTSRLGDYGPSFNRNPSLVAADSLSDAVDSLIAATDDLNEAATNLLHDAAASASNLMDGSDSSSSEGASDTLSRATDEQTTSRRQTERPLFPQRSSSSLRNPTNLHDLERNIRLRRTSVGSARRQHRTRRDPRQPTPAYPSEPLYWSRPRRFISRSSRRLSSLRRNNINRIISDVYAENHGHRTSLLLQGHIMYRLQYWDFTRLQLPEISSYRKNVIVDACKIYNDSSVDISRDGRLIAAFIPANTVDVMRPASNNLTEVAVFSLEPKTLGQILFRRECEHNLVCLSISPLSNRICVGFKYRHCLLGELRSDKVLMGHVFAMSGEEEMPLVHRIYHPAERSSRVVSVNTMSWSPQVGGGLAYGTNIGDVRMVSISPSEDNKIVTGISPRL